MKETIKSINNFFVNEGLTLDIIHILLNPQYSFVLFRHTGKVSNIFDYELKH